mgnify:CR=1 FL=1
MAVVDDERGWRRSAASRAGSPAIGEGGKDVGRMRRSEAEAVVELLELGDGADVEAWRKQSPVLCSSGDGR